MTLWPNGTKSKPHVSSGFGPRRAPTAGASTYHRGTDFSSTFSLIRAVEPGRVVAIDVWQALGYSVWIQHDGFFSKSGHMKNKPAVTVGEDVLEGRILGVMGKTGTATDTHLHFEITPGRWHTSNTGQIDPVPFITARLAATSGGGTQPAPQQPTAPPLTSTPEDQDMRIFSTTDGSFYLAKPGGIIGIKSVADLQLLNRLLNSKPGTEPQFNPRERDIVRSYMMAAE